MPSNIADLLSGMPSAVYPRWLIEEDRIQYMPAEGRYAMLLKVSNHWCGYVLVPNRECVAKYENKYIGDLYPTNHTPALTYSGSGSRAISWRWYNAAHQLKTIAQLNPEGDWWVGFDTMEWHLHHVPHLRETLIHFEHYIHEIVNDYSSAAR